MKILVIGGGGYFGQLLIEDLARNVHCEIVIGSRRQVRVNRFETVVADLLNPASLKIALNGVNIAICTAGPFQRLPAHLLELCLQRGIHYIDIADDREFVQRVRSLAAAKNDRAIAVCSAWSTVSALSGLLVRIATKRMSSVPSIYIHMAPGNRGARRNATIASLLYSVGQPFTVLHGGSWQRVQGWSEPRDFAFPSPIGVRKGYLVDVPDHDLIPQSLNAETVEFRAGSELKLLNASLGLIARTKRSWVTWSSTFQRLAALLSWIGHDSGGIGVEITGSVRRRASIVAKSRGERIAVMPASVMAAALVAGSEHHGLVSHYDWLTPEQLQSECERRDFRLVVEDL